MTKDQVSRLCRGLDKHVQCFRARPLEGRSYVWLDGKIERVRQRGGVRQKCLVIAYTVRETGRREVIGLDVGEAERGVLARVPALAAGPRPPRCPPVRVGLPRRPQGRDRPGLGCPWHRCTVHFLRNMLDTAPRPSSR